MGILLVALAAGLVVGVLSGLLVGPVAGILPALVVTGLAYFLLGRRVAAQLLAAMAAVQREIQARRVDAAVELLEGMKQKYGRLQFFASSSIDGQIGAILFMQGKGEKAKAHLENAFVRMWEPQGMLAALHAKKKDYAAVDRVMERAAKYNPKQGLLWSLWAYLHNKAGHRDKAIVILSRGREALGDKDPHLSQNLLALQNNKKLKMKGYGEGWYS